MGVGHKQKVDRSTSSSSLVFSKTEDKSSPRSQAHEVATPDAGSEDMSQHFYPRCAHLVLVALEHKSSLKSIVSSHCPVGQRFSLADQKRHLATVISLLAWRDALTHIVKAASVLETDKQVKRTLAMAWAKYVDQLNGSPEQRQQRCKHLRHNDDDAIQTLLLMLTHELLCSPTKRISSSPSWPPHRIVVAHRPRLQAELTRLQIKKGKAKAEELRTDYQQKELIASESGGWDRGRWVRVNARKATLDEVLGWLQSCGYQEHKGQWFPAPSTSSAPQFKPYIVPPRLSHAHNLILLPLSATADLVASEQYKAGKIILQDAASCWPAHILLESIVSKESESSQTKPLHVLDATAAPGNKTSHLSALLSSLPATRDVVVIALERDPQRYKILRSQLDRFGCLVPEQLSASHGKLKPAKAGLVTAVHADFLSMRSAELAPVTHMLLDPSCSGSGITGRLDWLTNKPDASENDEADDTAGDGGNESERLKKLSDIQVRMIEHAFQSCPRLERLVYSTCSIHRQEDEDVVFRALASPHARGKGWKWEVASRAECLPEWPWRGERDSATSDLDQGTIRRLEGMLRAYPYALLPSSATGSERSEGGAKPNGTTVGQDKTHVLRTNGFFAACFVKVQDSGEGAGLDNSKREDGAASQDAAGSDQDQIRGQNDAKRRKKQRQKDNKRRRVALEGQRAAERQVTEVQAQQIESDGEWQGCSD